ncbi:MAG TPA: hypothetical protein VK194_05610 [Candidatus Deferrimicrobium sp.]|nr:hypothetical protein [Candidatus Deferrimicrobium sp.]
MRDDASIGSGGADEPVAPAAEATRSASRRDGTAARQDLKATAAAIRADAQRLAGIEDEKSTLAADDPGFDRLSDDAVEVSERLRRETLAERQLADEIG